MTLFERIEKKIFFKIVGLITFLVAFLALIVTIAGIYTSLSNSAEIKAKNVEIKKEEIETVLKPQAQAESISSESSTNETTSINEGTQLSELQKIAESISKKALASRDMKQSDIGYNEILTKLTDHIVQKLSDYDEETKISALKQLESLSNSFKKEIFFESIDVYLSLFKSKQEHEKALVDQKILTAESNKTLAYSVVAVGMVVFALFVMILVLLRIEKNTRPQTTESDSYDATDKKLLVLIVGVAIAVAMLIGWAVNKTSDTNDESFDPVSQLRLEYNALNEQAATPPAQEALPVPAVDEAPAVEQNPDAAEAAPVEDQALAPAQAE